ncbi:MAG: hypothetical protein OHK006_13260 [Thermodesulfovibrionales bacterium]
MAAACTWSKGLADDLTAVSAAHQIVEPERLLPTSFYSSLKTIVKDSLSVKTGEDSISSAFQILAVYVLPS